MHCKYKIKYLNAMEFFEKNYMIAFNYSIFNVFQIQSHHISMLENLTF